MAAVNYRDLLLVGTSPRSTPSLVEQAYSGTAAYRNNVAPTNNAAFGTITTSATVDGNIVVTVPYTYTQGAVLADQLFIYVKESGGAVTSASPCTARSAVAGSMNFTLKPSTTYSFGLQAVRRTESGLVGTSIATSSDQALPAGNYTGTVNSVAAATVVTNASSGATAATGTAEYRQDVAPTNNAAFSAITSSATPDGNVVVSVPYTYTQGARKADGILIFVREAGGTVVNTDDCYSSNAVGSTAKFVLKPSTLYTFGLQAIRKTESGWVGTTILTSSNHTTTAGNYTGNFDSVPAATVSSNIADRVSKSADSILAAKVSMSSANNTGVAAGTLQWTSTGAYTSGYGVALTSGGLVGYNSSGVNTFWIKSSDGSAYFGGTLGANTVTTTALAADAVTATKVAAGAITTSKLTIAANSLVANSDFATGDFTNWQKQSQPASQSIVLYNDAGVPSGAPTRYVAKFAYTGAGANVSAFAAEKAYSVAGADRDGFAVTPSKSYYVSIFAAKAADYAAGGLRVYAYFYKKDGTYTTSLVPIIVPIATLTTSFAKYTGSFVAPADTTRCWLYVFSDTQTAGSVYFTSLVATENLVGVTINQYGIQVASTDVGGKLFFNASNKSPPWIVGGITTVGGTGVSIAQDPSLTDNTQTIRTIAGKGSNIVAASDDGLSVVVDGLGSETSHICLGAQLTGINTLANVSGMVLSLSAAGDYLIRGTLWVYAASAGCIPTVSFDLPSGTTACITSSVAKDTSGGVDTRFNVVVSGASISVTHAAIPAQNQLLTFDLLVSTTTAGAVQLKLGAATTNMTLQKPSLLNLSTISKFVPVAPPPSLLASSSWGFTAGGYDGLVLGFNTQAVDTVTIAFDTSGGWTVKDTGNVTLDSGQYLSSIAAGAGASYEIQITQTAYTFSGGTHRAVNSCSSWSSLSNAQSYYVKATAAIGFNAAHTEGTITIAIRPIGGSSITYTGLRLAANAETEN